VTCGDDHSHHGPVHGAAPLDVVDTHERADSSFLAQVKGGHWVRLTDPLGF
jgi:hypothetical protein